MLIVGIVFLVVIMAAGVYAMIQPHAAKAKNNSFQPALSSALTAKGFQQTIAQPTQVTESDPHVMRYESGTTNSTKLAAYQSGATEVVLHQYSNVRPGGGLVDTTIETRLMASVSLPQPHGQALAVPSGPTVKTPPRATAQTHTNVTQQYAGTGLENRFHIFELNGSTARAFSPAAITVMLQHSDYEYELTADRLYIAANSNQKVEEVEALLATLQSMVAALSNLA